MRKLILAAALLLAACGAPAPRNIDDGTLYARAGLNSVYDLAVHLRKQGKMSDETKTSILAATGSIETVIQMVEDGNGTDTKSCLALVNQGLNDAGQPGLAAVSSCLDAATQAVLALRRMMGVQ